MVSLDKGPEEDEDCYDVVQHLFEDKDAIASLHQKLHRLLCVQLKT